jgi:coenzyme PQQ synthesis protein D (PqqD)
VSTDDLTDDALLDQPVRVPDHVVHRAFVAETVVLNLQTGRYHGLNPSAGRMLDLLESTATPREAADRLAEEYGQPVDVIERDLAGFCRGMLDRKLIEFARGRGG